MEPFIVKSTRKHNYLTTFFAHQNYLNVGNAIPPDFPSYDITSSLDTITILPLEVENVLNSLVTGKASGPNGLSNRILKEFSKELANPFCLLINYSLQRGMVPFLLLQKT